MIGCESASAFCTRLIGVVRQAANHARNAVADVVRGLVEIAVESNSTVSDDCPSRLFERMFFTPSIPESSASRTCVMRVSMISA